MVSSINVQRDPDVFSVARLHRMLLICTELVARRGAIAQPLLDRLQREYALATLRDLDSAPHRRHQLVYSYPPRGMQREVAARYLGVGVTEFDGMVADRRMPLPSRIGRCVVWDRWKLDEAFSDLCDDNSRIEDVGEGRGEG